MMPTKHKRNRCKECPGCLAEDCGECPACKDNTKFGGPGKSHSCCIHRLCHVLYPDVGKDGKRIRERKYPVSPLPSPAQSVDTTPVPATTAPQAKTEDEGIKTPRPKRRRVEPKRIQDSLDRPQWLHRTKPTDGNESRKRAPEEVRIKAPARTSSMKHSGDPIFLKSSPLATPEDLTIQVPTPTLDEYVDKKIIEQDSTNPPPAQMYEATTMYGHKIPDAPPENTCAGCLGIRDKELEDNPIVLCDGEGCGREYHLNCCVPALSDEKEQDRWFCQDCCPNGGSTASLIRYLEESDLRKAEFLATSKVNDPRTAFIDHLLRLDAKRESKRLDRFPISQLERGALTDATARSDTVSRTRRGQEQTEPLSPDFFIGKAVRIFSLVGEQYHTGRIVDSRKIPKPDGDGNITLNDFEFLIRFPAGVEGRKSSHSHWIVLEEHGSCIGTTLVWAGMPDGSWQPSILWLRTARELVPIQHHLNESEGQIQYRAAHGTKGLDDTPLKSNFKVLGLVRPFGYHNVFHTLNAKDRMMDLFHETAIRDFLKDDKSRLQFALAKTEFNEQMRVRNWREMTLEDPMGYYALSSTDSYTLPLLQPSSFGKITLESHAALCPTLRRGLDRAKLLAMFQRRRGMKPTKDKGAAITCRLIEFHPSMMNIDDTARTNDTTKQQGATKQ